MRPDPSPITGDISRRRYLAAAATAAAPLGGCVGDAETAEDDGPVVVASFFTFYDFARRLAAETPIAVENLVPTGLHGHGWEPDPSITRDIVDADAFVHVGPEFQPWADRAIRTVEDDGADTAMINARAGIDLVPLSESLEADEAVEGGRDPHFWLDPERAAAAVDNVAAGLADVAPDHERTIADNADDLRAGLGAIDAEWRELFDRADREVAFLAAHNAFEYLSRRYGATILPLVSNLAADGDVRPADVRRAQDTIADRGIEHIGAAVFEPRRPARQLLEATAVEAYYPVTPYAGTTREWADREWGYFEIARNVNMPTFEIVLGAAEPTGEFDEEWRNFE